MEFPEGNTKITGSGFLVVGGVALQPRLEEKPRACATCCRRPMNSLHDELLGARLGSRSRWSTRVTKKHCDGVPGP